MKIKIDSVKGGFRADFTELPGSPIVGTGKTEGEAVATLFIRHMKDKHLPAILDFDYLEVNGEPYEDYIKQD